MPNEPVAPDHSIPPTRPSLLFRLQDWKDTASWTEFYRVYEKLVFGFALRSGLSRADAEEVTQDVFRRVAQTIGEFESNPQRGSFRGWLMNLTRWRTTDKFRELKRALPRHLSLREDVGDARTATIDRVPDATTTTVARDEVWEDEWQRHVMQTALNRLARRVETRHFQVFELHVCQGWPVARIAHELQMNSAGVYLIHFRLRKQLKLEVDRLKSQLR